MSLVATYTPDGIFYNGSQINDDGTVTMTRQFPIPFHPNRLCNPTGRLLGRRGRTIKWLCKETGCKIFVDTYDGRFPKVGPKVTIKARDYPSNVRAKMNYAIILVSTIIHPNGLRNTAMPDYLLSHAEDRENESPIWTPANFESANFGPHRRRTSRKASAIKKERRYEPYARSSSSASQSSSSSSTSSSWGYGCETMTPSAVNNLPATTFAPTYGSAYETEVPLHQYTQPTYLPPSPYPYPQQPYGGMQMNSYDPWAHLQASQAPALFPQQHHPFSYSQQTPADCEQKPYLY